MPLARAWHALCAVPRAMQRSLRKVVQAAPAAPAGHRLMMCAGAQASGWCRMVPHQRTILVRR
jgi:hypothetical protein